MSSKKKSKPGRGAGGAGGGGKGSPQTRRGSSGSSTRVAGESDGAVAVGGASPPKLSSRGSVERRDRPPIETAAAVSERRPTSVGDRKPSSGGGGKGLSISPSTTAASGGAVGEAKGQARPTGGGAVVGGRATAGPTSTTAGTPTQKASSHDQTTPSRKRASLSGSKEEPEGTAATADKSRKDSTSLASVTTKKPSTKAERRALQEAQRKKKAERQIAASKAGQAAREEKVAKEAAAGKGGGSHKGAGTTGGGASAVGGEDKQFSLLAKSTASKAHSSSKPPDVPVLKQVQHFMHLPQYERKTRITDLLRDHHPPPCILQLGLQYSEGLVCGSNARCIALLAAFKKVIQDYTTPPEKLLSRDLDSVIKPHINFLAHCRPLSVSMGNAIKFLKLRISQVPPDMNDSDAKKLLCEVIDNYIQEKIELASKAISEFCGKVINNGDVILVHAYSSVVQRSLIDAHRNGKKFRVIVVDSRPKMEGQGSLRQLLKEGIKCSYVLINAVSYIMKEVSKVIVGAHGLLANGYVMSRIGTSLIALVAKSYNVPVLVCCETYKFCDKVLTDSFVTNELGDPNDLVLTQRRQGDVLRDWKSIENLQLLNLVYDVTSPDLIAMVITQLGNIPCTSVPVVLRISRSFEQM